MGIIERIQVLQPFKTHTQEYRSLVNFLKCVACRDARAFTEAEAHVRRRGLGLDVRVEAVFVFTLDKACDRVC